MMRFPNLLVFFLIGWGAGLGAPGLGWGSSPEAHDVSSPLTPLEALPSELPPLSFSTESRLNKNVQFWVKVYSQHTTREGLIHDAKYIDRVYEVLDFRGSRKSHHQMIREAKRKWKQVLLSLHKRHGNLDGLSEDERKVFEMYRDIEDPNKFLNAAHRKRLRFQLGQKDRFLDGLYQSGRFLPMMEEIFKKEGMPVELTRLPFVESSFNLRARSKVGASGIWQFMRSTGRLFLKVNDAVDERNDPIRATEAAAKLLKLNFGSLRSWPLAITAYNHGRKGMMRAVRRVGSQELEDLISEYKGRSFGFASSNFFTELLAAIEVEKNSEKYFGKVERAKPHTYFEVKIPDFVALKDILKQTQTPTKDFKELNPGLTEAVYSGHLLVPAGYQIRIPYSDTLAKDLALKNFLDCYEQIPSHLKLRAQRGQKYDTSKGSIRRLKSSKRIRSWKSRLVSAMDARLF